MLVNTLKEFRIKRNLTQNDIAQATNVSRIMIWKYENNKATPKITFYENLAKKYNVNVSEFFKDGKI